MSQNNATIKDAFVWIGSVVGIIVSILSVLAYFNSAYVSKAELESEKSVRTMEIIEINNKMSEIQRSIINSQARIALEFQNTKAYGLIVRRDLLQSRSKLTPDESAELRLLESKLKELEYSNKTKASISDVKHEKEKKNDKN
jgi:hypothetical protein